MSAVIGALRIVLGADSAALEKGLKDAAVKLGVFAGLGVAAGEAFGHAIGEALRGVVDKIPETIEGFDKLSKTSQKIGVPVETLSALKHAADLSDVSVESLQKGLGKLAKSVVDAAQGSTTAVAAYQALGISFRDNNGRIKQVGDLLPEIADRFSHMKDGTVKTALAMQIFGKAGADLIPLLNGGSSGLAEMTTEARQLGLVIGTDTAHQAEAFNDNMTRLQRVTTGIVIQLTANMLPALANLSQFLVDSAKNSGFASAAVSALTAVFDALARTAIIVYDNLGLIVKIGAVFIGAQIGAAAISIGLAFVKLAASFRVAAVGMALFDAVRGISMRGILFMAGIVALAAGAFDGFSDKIKDLGNNIANLLPSGVGSKITEMLSAMGINLNGLTADLKSWKGEAGKDGGGLFNPALIKTTKDAVDSFIASKEKEIATFKASVATMADSNLAQEKAKIVAQGLAAATANHIPITEALKQKLQQLADTWATWNERATFGKQVFEQTRSPAEQFASTMERLNIAFENGQRDSDTYARAVAQAQQKLVDASPAAQVLSTSLSNAFDKAIDGGAKFSDILQGLLKDIVKLSAQAAFKSLLLGNAGSGGTSGGILGSIFGGGLGKLFGFASGGSFEVGGAGGIDSQVAAFRVTPGERVTVTKPGQAMSGGSGTFVDQSTNNFQAAISGTDRAWIAQVVDQKIAASEARQRTYVNSKSLRRAQ